MKKFENRIGSDLNKRKMVVEEVERNEAGEIVSITGDLIRADLKSTGGTPLKANDINTVMQKMIDNEFNTVFDRKFLPHIEYTYETKEMSVCADGSSASIDGFSFTMTEPSNIKVINKYNNLFDITYTVNEQSGEVSVLVRAKLEPATEGTNELDFKIILTSRATGEIIHKFLCTVIYDVPSVTPDD